MKINRKQTVDAIVIPDNFAMLSDIAGGFCQYVFSYNIDPSLALKLHGSKVRIHISKENLTPSYNSTLSTTNDIAGIGSVSPSNVISSILTRKSTIKDNLQATRNKILFSFISDFTVNISNTDTAKLKAANGKPIAVQQERKFVTATVDSAIKSNNRPAVLETPLFASTKDKASSSGSVRESSQNMLFELKVDPASLMVKQRAIGSAHSVHGGIYKTVGQTFATKQSAKVQTLVSSLNSTGTVTKPTMQTLAKESYYTAPIQLSNTTLVVNELADIPLDIVGGEDFYVIYDLVDADDQIIERKSAYVSHSKWYHYFQTPTIPPSINIAPVSKAGSVKIEIKQNDPKAIGVLLYRKLISAVNNNSSSFYVRIGDIPLQTSEGWKHIDDRNAGGKLAIYRAIPYGTNGLLAAEFGSAVTKSENLDKYATKNTKPSYTPFTSKITESGVSFLLSNIPDGTVCVKLLRTDIPNRSKRFVGKPILLTNQDKGSINFIDSDVYDGRCYIYNAVLISKTGTETQCPTEIFLEYKPAKTNVLSTTINNQQYLKSGSDVDVSFSLSTSFLELGETQIKSTLEKQGLGQLFMTELNKEKLRELYVYNIVRVNLDTNEVDDLGFTNESEILDSKLSSITGARGVSSGSYRYVVTTYLRNPDTLLENYVVSVEDEKYPSKSYTYKPNKWRHPLTLESGTLTSPAALKRNHAKSPFSFGSIASIAEMTVSIPEITPTILNAKATKINSELIKVSWTIKGNIQKIDHFIVMVEILGMRSIAGKCHNISDTGNLEFIDTLTDNEKGELSYVVIPVFNNYERGKEVKTNGVLL